MTDNDIDLYADDIDQDFAQVSGDRVVLMCGQIFWSARRVFTSRRHDCPAICCKSTLTICV